MSSLSQQLTIFTTCKPFKGDIGVMQRNALETWRDLACPIIIVGTEQGVREHASQIGATHVADNRYHTSGMPYVNDVFSLAQNTVTTPYCCYINADILLPPNVGETLTTFLLAINQTSPFLLTARRRNVPLNKALPDDQEARKAELRCLDTEYGTWDSSSAVDFFLFPTGMFTDLPSFLFGRMQWDNWLLWKAREMGAQIIDASFDMHLLHPIHGYAGDGTNWLIRAHGEDAAANRQLAGENSLDISGACNRILRNGILQESNQADMTMLEAHCRPEPDKELKAGLACLTLPNAPEGPEELVDFCRTLLWRSGYFFPSLLDAGALNADVEAAMSLARSDKPVDEKARGLERLVSSKFLRILKKRHNSRRPIFIWGAGTAGLKVLDFLAANEIQPSGFLDSNRELSGKKVRSFPVAHPDDILPGDDGLARPFVLVASMYAKEIAKTLEKKGFTFKQDYMG